MVEILSEMPLPQLALFAVLSSLSPGPNNLLIAASGAGFGARRSLPTLAGMYAGFCLMFAAAGLGAAMLFAAVPALLSILQMAGVCYLLFLSSRLLKATWRTSTGVVPPGFLNAMLLQFLNPKLWLMTL